MMKVLRPESRARCCSSWSSGLVTPATVATSKLKKGEGSLSLELVRTEDILAGLGQKKGDRLLVGFAAETDDLVARARGKLKAKGLDLVVANDVREGFEGDTNAATLLRREGKPTEIPRVSKRELADRICDEIVQLRARVGEPAPVGTGPE